MVTAKTLMKTNPQLSRDHAASLVAWMRGTTSNADLEAGTEFWTSTKPRSLASLRRLRATLGLKRDDQGRIVGYNAPKRVVKLSKRERLLVAALQAVAPDHPVLQEISLDTVA